MFTNSTLIQDDYPFNIIKNYPLFSNNIHFSEIARNSKVIKGRDLFPRLNKNINLRHMLSNETINVNYLLSQYSDYFIIVSCLIIIISLIFFLRYLYKKWQRMKDAQEEKNENNDLSDKAKFEFEMNYLNAKTFSFIPLSSPIKIKNNIQKSQSDKTSEENNDNNSTFDSDTKNDTPEKLKEGNISPFCIEKDLDDKIVVNKI